jgi:hypothetical protein
MKAMTGQVYRHFKGNQYLVLEIAVHTETGEELVIYCRADDKDDRVWARPREMFEGVNEKGVPRFEEPGSR